ncbi:MAG: hypothetical protein IJQ82_10345 [Selenomonadaceae bacterium]|nr:hypothetical protein [Selenomonadaceae bacterium]
MKTAKLKDMVRGWFVGNFEPTLYKTNDVEVAIQNYDAGAFEAAHYHKIATEITVIQSGTVKMFDKVWNEGDIIIIEPGEVTSFEALTDAVTVVVKLPGANNDKYLA